MMDQDFDGKLPPIRVIIAKGDEDVTIKVCDRGGGIPRSSMQSIWKFAHSTASEKELECEFGKDVVSGARIRGFGLVRLFVVLVETYKSNLMSYIRLTNLPLFAAALGSYLCTVLWW